jgi:hypothetical protein
VRYYCEKYRKNRCKYYTDAALDAMLEAQRHWLALFLSTLGGKV